MYDHLDDQDPPVPASDALATVHGRARFLRRRRAALVGGSGTAAVAIIALLVATLAGGGSPQATRRDLLDAPTETATAPATTSAPTQTPSATPSPTASPTPSSAPRPTVTRSPLPRPTATPTPGEISYGGCRTADTVPTGPSSTEIVPGLTVAFTADATVASGDDVAGSVVFTNHRDHALSVEMHDDSLQIRVKTAGYTWSDAIGEDQFTIPAGGEETFTAHGVTTTCDAVPEHLAAGDYPIGVDVVLVQVNEQLDDESPSPSPSGLVPPGASTTPDPQPSPTPSRVSLLTNASLGGTVTVT